MAAPRTLKFALACLVAFSIFSLFMMVWKEKKCPTYDKVLKQNANRNKKNEMLWGERLFYLFFRWIPGQESVDDIEETAEVDMSKERGDDIARAHTQSPNKPEEKRLSKQEGLSDPKKNDSSSRYTNISQQSENKQTLNLQLTGKLNGRVAVDQARSGVHVQSFTGGGQRGSLAFRNQISGVADTQKNITGISNTSKIEGTKSNYNQSAPHSYAKYNTGNSSFHEAARGSGVTNRSLIITEKTQSELQHNDSNVDGEIRAGSQLPDFGRRSPIVGRRLPVVANNTENDIIKPGNNTDNRNISDTSEVNKSSDKISEALKLHNSSDTFSVKSPSRHLTSLGDNYKSAVGVGESPMIRSFQDRATDKDEDVNAICDLYPTTLVGLLRVTIPQQRLSIREVTSRHPEVTSGGQWRPEDCEPRQSVVVIVPFMNRWDNLTVFLDHIHPFLQRQKLRYQIVVVEQIQPELFNRGAILNAGFLEFGNGSDVDCVVFHDVDLLPEHDHNLYRCTSAPVHLSPSVNTLGYGSPGRRIGGVSAYTPRDFRSVNGFSNSFHGWGGEDDDIYMRLSKWRHIPVERPEHSIGRYTMIPHQRDPGNPPAPNRLRGATFRGTRYSHDGLNSIQYRVKHRENFPLFTLISVNIIDPGDI